MLNNNEALKTESEYCDCRKKREILLHLYLVISIIKIEL